MFLASAASDYVHGYTLAIASFMLLAGSTADRIGRRRVFQAGLGLFTAASLACSLALLVEQPLLLPRRASSYRSRANLCSNSELSNP